MEDAPRFLSDVSWKEVFEPVLAEDVLDLVTQDLATFRVDAFNTPVRIEHQHDDRCHIEQVLRIVAGGERMSGIIQHGEDTGVVQLQSESTCA